MDFGLTLWAAESDPSVVSSTLSVIWRVIIVLLGINALIIVHEWGHFIVARLCGVRCEKFYIWFDVKGFRFFRFKWGGTEYGLGWLPLGGYVKMLGQEDNPAAIKEEIARAKAEGQSTDKLEEAEKNLYAPDSYLSKNVPQRMAIISAGVVMNVIFAIICAMAAAMIGFPETTSRIGTVYPATPAWSAGIRAGDAIVGIDRKPVELYAQIPLAMMNGEKVQIELKRDDQAEPISLDITPRLEKDGLMPTIGILPSKSLELAAVKRPFETGNDAASEEAILKRFGAVQGGDRLLTINGEKVESPSDYERLMRKNLSQTIRFEFAPVQKNGTVAVDQVKTVEAPAVLAANCGLRLTPGPITAIRVGSPAEQAGLKKEVRDETGQVVEPGDYLVAINNEPIGDPIALPGKIHALTKNGTARETVVLTVRHGEEMGEQRDVTVTLDPNGGYTGVLSYGGNLAIGELGIAFSVLPVVSGTDSNVIFPTGSNPIGATVEKIAVTVKTPGEEVPKEIAERIKSLRSLGSPTEDGFEIDVNLPDKAKNQEETLRWFAGQIHEYPDGTKIRLTVRPVKGESFTLETEVRRSEKTFLLERGLYFGVETRIYRAHGREALRYGWDKTLESMGQVFKFFRNVGRNVSAKALGGPVTIVGAAWRTTETGDGLFLLFLCLIGANLAVINILPIPVLDGGHLVFLLYEAIFRRPPNENVEVILSFIGLFLILALMFWVFFLDFARLGGWL